MPSLEESPLQALNVGISISFSSDRQVQSPDEIQRIERAGMLPARWREFRG
jgi:hypothetical protein